MDSNCLTCGGLIMEPGKNYSYAGKVCHCFEDRVRRRATEPWIRPPFYVEEIKKLQKENAELRTAIGAIYQIVATYGKITRGELSSVLDHAGAGKHIGGPRDEEKEG